MELSGLSLAITLGAYIYRRAPRVTILSQRHRPLTWTEITLADAQDELWRNFPYGAAASVALSYRNQAQAVWPGTVRGLRTYGKDENEVSLLGPDGPLAATRIQQAWENETPEAIIRWAVGQAGLPLGRIDSPGVTLPRFVADDIPVYQVAERAAHSVQRAFDIDMSRWALWLGADGVNWGDFEEAGDVPVIATGGGLIAHTPVDLPLAWGEVETFLLPDLTHSRTVRIQDMRRGIDGTFRALRVRHEITPASARTFVAYGDEHGRY